MIKKYFNLSLSGGSPAPVDAEMRGRREVGCSDTGSLGVSGTETETEAGVGRGEVGMLSCW